MQDFHAFPSEMQTRIFMPSPPNKRKVVIVDFADYLIYYKVDPGFMEQKIYSGLDALVAIPYIRYSIHKNFPVTFPPSQLRIKHLYRYKPHPHLLITTPLKHSYISKLSSVLVEHGRRGLGTSLQSRFCGVFQM